MTPSALKVTIIASVNNRVSVSAIEKLIHEGFTYASSWFQIFYNWGTLYSLLHDVNKVPLLPLRAVQNNWLRCFECFHVLAVYKIFLILLILILLFKIKSKPAHFN
jgi:hypothetical protein